MAAADRHSLAGKRILVVEDEYWLAREIAGALKDVGAEVIGPASTLLDAQRLLESHSPDCAVLDVNLHGQMALPIADHLRSAEVPFAIATGYDRQALPASLAGAPHLKKPFDPRELRSLLPALISGEAATD